MTAKQPFCPAYGSNQVLTANSGSQVANINKESSQLRIVNTGANIAYVQAYSSLQSPAPAAGTNDFPIPAGIASTITKDLQHDRLAYISAAGTTLQVMTGEGF